MPDAVPPRPRAAGPSPRPDPVRHAIIPPVTPLLIAALGAVALVAGGLVLRTFGAAYRIGRLLATAPTVSVAEANAIAIAGRRAYVRIAGRIDADDEFEDADHRPLVFRRVRLETREGRSWRAFEDHRQSVPFTVNEGLDTIAIDADALDAGLIVVRRESVGRAADLADRAPEHVDPETTVRARIDQISSVEHAIVVGYPVAIDTGRSTTNGGVGSRGVGDGDNDDRTHPRIAAPSAGPAAADAPPSGPTSDPAGRPVARMTAGRGRPLILTVLEPPEAMRILAGGDAGRTRLAAGLLGAGAILIAGALLWAGVTALLPAIVTAFPAAAGLVPRALAATPEPSAAVGGDPRSNGQGPGLVGTPGLAILGVALVGIVAVVVTTIYVRLTAPDPARRTPAELGTDPRSDPAGNGEPKAGRRRP